MKIRIDGGIVVGWSGTGHEIIPNGSVLIDGDCDQIGRHGQVTASGPGHRCRR